MRTIILAGGEGKRLRPLTCTMPKPLVPLLNKPILFYTLELLKKHGFCDITVTLGYMADAIKNAVGSGEGMGLDIKYSNPHKKLGTAGSARHALGEDLRDTVLIISGDAMTDFDLGAAYRAHIKSRADVTVLLYSVERPMEYGIATTDKNGLITGFLEKPSPGQVFSDRANTGVYFIEPKVFEDMPPNTELDFSKDVFPKLIKNGAKMLGLEMRGYWSDVGNPAEFNRTQRDMLLKKCAFNTAASEKDGVFTEPGAEISPKAKLVSPCYIGAEARIAAYACVEADSVVGSGAVLEEDSSVKRTILLPGAVLRQGAEVRGAIVCERAEIGRDSAVFEGAVIGAGSTVERGATVCPGVLVWPEKTVERGEKCKSSISWGSASGLKASGSRFAGGGDSRVTPETAVRIAAAYAAGLHLPAEILIGGDGKASSAMLKHALASGAVSQGAEALLAEPGSRYAFASLLRHIGAAGGLYAAGDDNSCEVGISLYDSRGIEADAQTMRAVETALRFGEQQPVTRSELGLMRSVGGGDMCLAADIGRSVQSRQLAENPARLILNAPYDVCRDIAAYMLRYGWSVDCAYDCKRLIPVENSNTISILIDENERVSCMTDAFTTLDSYRLLTAIAEDMHIKTAVVPLDLDPELEARLDSLGITCICGPESAEARRRLAAESGCYSAALLEPVVMAVKACELYSNGGLKRAAEELPRCQRRTAEYKVPAGRAASVMRGMVEDGPGEVCGVAEGVKLKHDTGWVTVKPCPERASFRVVAGSMSSEYAKELCDVYLEKLRSLKTEK